MSFPSAKTYLEDTMGVALMSATTDQADEAMLHAMRTDTPEGFVAIEGLVEAMRNKDSDPVTYIKTKLEPFGVDAQNAVLRWEHCGAGIKVDFDPDSKVGRQYARLMTDVAREVLEKHFKTNFGFVNCCGGKASDGKDDTKSTSLDQIRWQNSIDC